jgi:hypothetical protein
MNPFRILFDNSDDGPNFTDLFVQALFGLTPLLVLFAVLALTGCASHGHDTSYRVTHADNGTMVVIHEHVRYTVATRTHEDDNTALALRLVGQNVSSLDHLANPCTGCLLGMEMDVAGSDLSSDLWLFRNYPDSPQQITDFPILKAEVTP